MGGAAGKQENTLLCPRMGAPALSPTLKAPRLPILSASSWGCCTPPACSPLTVGSPLPGRPFGRPCYTETQGLWPGQDTVSCPVLPEVPTARDIQPPGPSGGQRQVHPERLRLRLMLLDVLLNTKQAGECQLEMTFSGRSQVTTLLDFLPQQSGCRGV